jgi:hypothetical protein
MKTTIQPPLRPPKKANRHKRLSPIEQLQADKTDLKEKCRIQEKKIRANLTYMQDHTGRFLLSGISSLLCSAKSSARPLPTRSVTNPDKLNNSRYSLSNYRTIAKVALPLVWEILQPILITWGLSQAKSLIKKLLSGKKMNRT